MARASEYTEEIANIICERLSLGYSLRTVCKDENLPSIATVFNWFKIYPDFLEQYTRAKQEAADALADEIQFLSDEVGLDKDAINKARLQIDTRKWLMAKMKPKKYGEKLDMTSGGEKLEGPVVYLPKRNDPE